MKDPSKVVVVFDAVVGLVGENDDSLLFTPPLIEACDHPSFDYYLVISLQILDASFDCDFLCLCDQITTAMSIYVIVMMMIVMSTEKKITERKRERKRECV